MSKITVTTLAGHTSGGDANKVKIESGDTLEVVSNATVGGTLTTTGTATFQGDVNVGNTTNLITNSTFDTNTTGWAATGSTLAIVSNELQITPNSGVNGFANQQVDNLVIGKSYVASVYVTVDAGNYSRLYIGTSANGNQTVTSSNLGIGAHSFTFVATATTHHFALVVGGGNGQVTRFNNARLTEASRVIFPAVTGTSPEIKQGTTVNDLALATNSINRLNIDANGHVTMPSQPAVQAALTSNQSNITAGSLYTIPFATEVFDQNADYNNSSYTFTAPVTGRYFIGIQGTIGGQPLAADYYQYAVQTSNRTYNATVDPDKYDSSPVYDNFNFTVLADMDANDTCIVKLLVEGSSNTFDFYSQTYLSIFLAC